MICDNTECPDYLNCDNPLCPDYPKKERVE